MGKPPALPGDYKSLTFAAILKISFMGKQDLRKITKSYTVFKKSAYKLP